MNTYTFWHITRRDLPCLLELQEWLNKALQQIGENEDMELFVAGEIDDSKPWAGNNLFLHLAALDPSKGPKTYDPYVPVSSFCCCFLAPNVPGYLISSPDDQQADGGLSVPPGDIDPS